MKKILIYGGIAVVLIAISYFGYKAYKAKQVPVSTNPGVAPTVPFNRTTPAATVSATPVVNTVATR